MCGDKRRKMVNVKLGNKIWERCNAPRNMMNITSLFLTLLCKRFRPSVSKASKPISTLKNMLLILEFWKQNNFNEMITSPDYQKYIYAWLLIILLIISWTAQCYECFLKFSFRYVILKAPNLQALLSVNSSMPAFSWQIKTIFLP